jgi:hypothetical protein
MSQISVDSVIPQSGSTITIGGSGDTVTLGSGASQSGFGSAAYAANASASTGAVNVDASDNLQFDSGYGSTATAYGCRAWVNFNGTGTVAIRDSGNVSSITDNGVGLYTMNFTTAMPDTNYSVVGIVANTGTNFSNEAAGEVRGPSGLHIQGTTAPTVNTVKIETRLGARSTQDGLNADLSVVSALIIR